MNFLNWKSIAALGASIIGIIFAVKMSPEQATEVSIHAIDVFKGTYFGDEEE